MQSRTMNVNSQQSQHPVNTQIRCLDYITFDPCNVVITLYTGTWGCLDFVKYYEGARRTRTVTNDGDDDDGNPAPQFLVSKTYLGGKKNQIKFEYLKTSFLKICQSTNLTH